ncbi:MAG: hypothetical protein JWO36_3352 [Myxococcales bacterium]|nr:hypothetical protein [Myxococcales bacterium]
MHASEASTNLDLRMAVDQYFPEDTGSNTSAIRKVARAGIWISGAGVMLFLVGWLTSSLAALAIGVCLVPIGLGTLGVAAFFGYADWAVRRKRPAERAILLSGAYRGVTLTTLTLKGSFGQVKGQSHGVRVRALSGKYVFIPTNAISGERLAQVLQRHAQPE